MDSDFTAEEYTDLISALETWERDISRSGMMGEMMGAIFLDKLSPDAKGKYEAEQKVRKAKDDAATRERSDKASILKAKLILKRRAVEAKTASNIVDDASVGLQTGVR